MKFELQYFDSLPSTNMKAVRNVQEGKAQQGMVIWTGEQTQGKGNGDNQWESEKGKNLTFSLVLQPHFLQPSEQFILTQMVSMVLYNVIIKLLPFGKLQIKWPNDLYFNRKKIAGVLIQNFVRGQQINFSVIGIGLNVNQKTFTSNAPNPASLIHFTGGKTALPTLLDELLRHLENNYKIIKGPQGKSKVQQAYLEHLYQINQWSPYRDKAGTFTGRINGINNFGQLLIEDNNGNHRVYGFKEIEFL